MGRHGNGLSSLAKVDGSISHTAIQRETCAPQLACIFRDITDLEHVAIPAFPLLDHLFRERGSVSLHGPCVLTFVASVPAGALTSPTELGIKHESSASGHSHLNLAHL